MNFLVKIGNGITKVNTRIAKIASILIFPLIAVIIYEVFMRYIFNAPTIFSFDLQWMICGSMVFLGGAYALADNVHVRADILYNLLPKRVQATLDLVLYPVFFFSSTIAIAYAVWGGFRNAWVFQEASRATSWGPYTWPVRLVLFIAICMLIVQGIVKFGYVIEKFIKGDPDAKAGKRKTLEETMREKAEDQIAEVTYEETEVAEETEEKKEGGDVS